MTELYYFDGLFFKIFHRIMFDIARDESGLVDRACGGNQAVVQFQLMTFNGATVISRQSCNIFVHVNHQKAVQ